MDIFSPVIEIFQSLLKFYLEATNPILALILLSLSMFVLFLPLYKISDKVVARDKIRREVMLDDLEKIKRVSNSVERYHYTRVVYRLNNYHPIQSLLGIVPLLLQLPLFLMAYFGLHSFVGFEGMSWGLIKDFSHPDSLWLLLPDELSIHLLPIVMTGISILSGWFYVLSDKKIDKIQLFFFPLVFLVLLYNEPSGLVIYWTMNNILSCVKNYVLVKKKGIRLRKHMPSFKDLLMKYQDLRSYIICIWIFVISSVLLFAFYFMKLASIIFHGKLFAKLVLLDKGVIVLLSMVYVFFVCSLILKTISSKRQDKKIDRILHLHIVQNIIWAVLLMLFVILHKLGVLPTIFQQYFNMLFLLLLEIGIILQIIFTTEKYKCRVAFQYIGSLFRKCGHRVPTQRVVTLNTQLALVLGILVGVVAPLIIVRSDPIVFMKEISVNVFVFKMLITVALVSLAITVLSFLLRARIYVSMLLSVLFLYCVYTVFIRSGDYGTLDFMKFANGLDIPIQNRIRDLVVLTLIILITLHTFVSHKYKLMRIIIFSVFIVESIVVVDNLYLFNFKMESVVEKAASERNDTKQEDMNPNMYEPVYQLSKNNKNIIILMLDRFIGGYVPLILEEDPSLKERLDGFVYFPNSVSQATSTRNGFPPIVGGYEYTLQAASSLGQEYYYKGSNYKNKYVDAFTLIPYALKDSFESSFVDVDPTLSNEYFDSLAKRERELNIHILDTNYYRDDYFNSMMDKTDEHKNLQENFVLESSKLWSRFLIMLSLFRASGDILRENVYTDGQWLKVLSSVNTVREYIIKPYAALDMLSELSSVENSNKNIYLLIHNQFTHNVYDPDFIINYFGKGISDRTKIIFLKNRDAEIEKNSLAHYIANFVALHRVADWLDWLKMYDIYDNTKIYLASDHGTNIINPMLTGDSLAEIGKSRFDSLFMLKDFGERGAIKTNYEFRIMSDVAYEILTSEGLRVNPYTQRPLVKIDFEPVELNLDDINYRVIHKNILDKNNWKIEGQ